MDIRHLPRHKRPLGSPGRRNAHLRNRSLNSLRNIDRSHLRNVGMLHRNGIRCRGPVDQQHGSDDGGSSGGQREDERQDATLPLGREVVGLEPLPVSLGQFRLLGQHLVFYGIYPVFHITCSCPYNP